MYRFIPVPKTEILSQVGIQETLDAIKFLDLFLLGYNVSVGSDGKVNIPADLPNFIQAGLALPAAIQGFGKIPGELADLDEDEQPQLVAALSSLTNDENRKRLLAAFVEFGDALVDLVKNQKTEPSVFVFSPVQFLPQSGEYGIEETTDVFNFLALMVDGVQKALADGKIDINDITHFINVIFALPKAIEGAENIPSELTDLQEEEITAIVGNFSQIVSNVYWQRVFAGFVSFADAFIDVVK